MEDAVTEFYFVDTTFRDGHASLWAEGMTTDMMLSVAPQVDRAGFTAMEVIATSHFKKCVRELHEDPWERIRLLARKVTRTPMAAMSGPHPPGGFGGFDVAPRSITKLWLERLAANGIRRVQIMEPSNDMRRMDPAVRYARAAGMQVVLALVYSLSPRHTDAYYAQKAADAVPLEADVVYLKDPGGLLTPERVRTLVPAILGRIGPTRLELHSHCTTGLAPLCYLEAVQLGVQTLHTAIPPLANGASQPSVFNVARNARLRGFVPTVDEDAVAAAADHLGRLAQSSGLPAGAPVEYDGTQYVHQVPGGVMSNLRHQLSQIGMGDRLEEVLEETVRVRRDLGYPIMVTPFSQFVVTQAAMNVLAGERYKEIADEIFKYALGFYGTEASAGIDPEILGTIVDRPRAKELMSWKVPEPSVDDVRQTLGGSGVTDDELLLRYIMGGPGEIQRMRAAGPTAGLSTASSPLVQLIRGLLERPEISHVAIEGKGFSLVLRASG